LHCTTVRHDPDPSIGSTENRVLWRVAAHSFFADTALTFIHSTRTLDSRMVILASFLLAAAITLVVTISRRRYEAYSAMRQHHCARPGNDCPRIYSSVWNSDSRYTPIEKNHDHSWSYLSAGPPLWRSSPGHDRTRKLASYTF
jgi:G:T/U-mismatch repair DNA glycosylase